MDLALLLAGFAAGFVHVLMGPDHLAAVAPLAAAASRPGSTGSGTEPKRSGTAPWRTGLRWGLGHSLGVAVVGLLALWLRDLLPLEALSRWSERAVGLVLLGLGTWGLFQLAGRVRPRTGRHAHAALSVGVLHGFAGSSHLLGVLPALALDSAASGVLWLISFAAGTVVSMTGFSASLGGLARRVGDAGARLILGGSSTVALAAGLWWLLRPLPTGL